MRNTVNIIKNKKARFSNNFCFKRFENANKCYQFYMNNIKNNTEGIVRCPYGYACYFYKNIVISSIIDNKICDLKCILARNRYLRKSLKIEEKVKILSNEELEELITNIKIQNEFDIYRDTFHDLNNNNRPLKDIVERINNLLNDSTLTNLNRLFKVFEEHKCMISQVNDVFKKLEIYKMEILDIDEIKNIILKDKALKNRKLYDLKSNLEFIDYRIRYLKRLVNNEYNCYTESYKKNLNIHKIITKLKYAFECTMKKKEQNLNFISSNEIEKFDIVAYDDIYLGFFILFENAIKYSPLGSTINVITNHLKGNAIEIIIENESSYISNVDILTKRGTQGENCKDGSGLGLSIAEEIFAASDLTLSVNYNGGKFICTIVKNEYLTAIN